MLKELIKQLIEEEKILKKLISAVSEQNQAFIDYDTNKISVLNNLQDDLLHRLSQHETERINLLCTWLKINKKEAYNLKLSTIERNLKGDAKSIVSKLKNSFAELNAQLIDLNRNNRILANRARFSINNILKMFADGKNVVLNVKV